MQTVTTITLTDQDRAFRVRDDAHDVLRRYLQHAEANLADDPGRAEVISDLERSIGDKLAMRLGNADRVLTTADVDAVLGEIGPVGGDEPAIPAPVARPRGRRKLYRIHEGQNIAGVCTGLSAYAEIDIDWVRTIFVLLALATAGIFILVYIVLAFALPVVATRAEWLAATDG